MHDGFEDNADFVEKSNGFIGDSGGERAPGNGWEYEPTGKTGKIPDAGCFRPWDRDTARLNTYRVETLGDLIFVALSERARSTWVTARARRISARVFP